MPFSDGQGQARDILVGVCSGCETVVAIPPQSTPAQACVSRGLIQSQLGRYDACLILFHIGPTSYVN
ncbi:hypothetical protein CXQ80_15820 [Pseudomonas sp. 02C 26]|nr:hypothetical protein CXQ80_15820 [Pseudomonas sp. 02C 26]